MPHAQPWMSAIFDVPRRAAKPVDQKVAQTLLRAGKIAFRIQRAKDSIVRNLGVERMDQTGETVFSNKAVQFVLFHESEGTILHRLGFSLTIDWG